MDKKNKVNNNGELNNSSEETPKDIEGEYNPRELSTN